MTETSWPQAFAIAFGCIASAGMVWAMAWWWIQDEREETKRQADRNRWMNEPLWKVPLSIDNEPFSITDCDLMPRPGEKQKHDPNCRHHERKGE